jgi:hypothetical protein
MQNLCRVSLGRLKAVSDRLAMLGVSSGDGPPSSSLTGAPLVSRCDERICRSSSRTFSEEH